MEYKHTLITFVSETLDHTEVQIRYDKKGYKHSRWNLKLYARAPQSGNWISIWNFPHCTRDNIRALYDEMIDRLLAVYPPIISNVLYTPDGFVWIRVVQDGFFYTINSCDADMVFCAKKHATLGKAIDHITKIEHLDLDLGDIPDDLWDDDDDGDFLDDDIFSDLSEE